MIRILIVEDESIVAMEIAQYVRQLGYTVSAVCSSGHAALDAVAGQPVDIILMDIRIKGEMDGIETAEQIRQHHPDTRVIFLTAHMDDYNVNRAIALDPVGYLAKPLRREELRVFLKIAAHKKMQSLTRLDPAPMSLSLDDEFAYDRADETLYWCGEALHLTKKESDLLALFIRNKNQCLDLYTIENTIWPEKTANANTIRTLVRRIREKLKHRFIETVSGRGYRFVTKSHKSLAEIQEKSHT